MIDQELHVEDVIDMYNEKILILQKEIDRLNEEVQVLNMELMQERAKKNVISKS
jgi:hypothetical protein